MSAKPLTSAPGIDAELLPVSSVRIHRNLIPHLLRKDYAYLFERFYYSLEDKEASPAGIIVFDELEKSLS